MAGRKKLRLPGTTGDLREDPGNPSQIGNKARRGLGRSLADFGDISGITWNRRTGELVCGHKRLRLLRAKYGELPIEAVDDETGVIRIPGGDAFRVRVVDWPRSKQLAANIAANSQAISGRFTEELQLRLAEVKEAEPEQYDALLFARLEDDEAEETAVQSYDVVVMCESAEERHAFIEELTSAGRKCRMKA
jgi:hypothetical protein